MSNLTVLDAGALDDAYAEAKAQRLKASANNHYSGGQYTRAAKLYTGVIENFEHQANTETIRTVRCNRAACYLELGDEEKAAEDCRDVLASDTGTEASRAITQKAHLRLARSLQRQGNLEEATTELDEFRNLNGRPEASELSTRVQILEEQVARDNAFDANYTCPIRYEVRVSGHDIPPIVIEDEVSSALCCVDPPQIPARVFLMNLVDKYHNKLMQMRAWTCSKCRSRAVNMIHTPASYLHLPVPMIIDYAEPVCVNGKECGQQRYPYMAQEINPMATYYL